MADGFVQSLHSALGARECVIASSAPTESTDFGAAGLSTRGPSQDRATARELAAALDRAVELGQWLLAERIAGQSIRVAKNHPLLAERIARLRAARGDFETALTIIESCRGEHASLRLLRAVCLLQAGRSHEAHADLLHWSRKAAAPLQARLILALLEWKAGHHDDAALALQRNLRQIEDPATLAALMLMTEAEDRSQMSRHWAQRLRAASAGQAQPSIFDVVLLAAGHGQSRPQVVATAEAIAALATELLANEPVIPALVEAQRLAPDAETCRLLAGAIASGLDEMESQGAAMFALADLHDLLDEAEIAAAWRSRGRSVRRDDVLASIGRGSALSPDFEAFRWRERAA